MRASASVTIDAGGRSYKLWGVARKLRMQCPGAEGLITDSYQLSYARSISQWTGWLYWGGGNTPQSGDTFPDRKYLHHQSLGAVMHSLSSWNPNPILRNIGAKQLPGPYMLLQSRCNYDEITQTYDPPSYRKPARPRQPDPRYCMRSVYVNLDYALGASYRHEEIMDPYLPSAVDSTVVWRSSHDQNWLMPVHPYWFTLRKWEGTNDVLGDEDWSGPSPFMQMVHWENATIMAWDIPRHDPYEGRAGKGNPLFNSERTLDLIQGAYVYVPESMDERREAAGAFFLREGDVYIGIRPLRGGAHWEPSRHTGFSRLALPGALVGFALEVGDKREFGSFDAFQKKVAANRLDLSAFQKENRVAYRSSRGHLLTLRHKSPGWLPEATVNGVPLDFARWPTCESPYVNCRNRVLDVNDGRNGFTIDWRQDLPVYEDYELTPKGRHVTKREHVADGKLVTETLEGLQAP